MSHTPGPWLSVANLSASENHRGFRIASEPTHFYLAEVRPMDEDGKEGGANARLIAAAPELLEALQKLMTLTEVFLSRPEAHSEITRACAAIAKATGDSNAA